MLRIALIAAMFWATPALALDFSQKVYGADETKPIQVDGGDLTLGVAVAQALFANQPGDEKLSGEEKFKRGVLALKIRGGGDVQVTAEEIATMKKVVAAGYGSLMVARIWPLLDLGLKVNSVTTETVPSPEPDK